MDEDLAGVPAIKAASLALSGYDAGMRQGFQV